MAEYDIICSNEKCDHVDTIQCGMNEISNLKNVECPKCNNKTLEQNYATKRIIDIWKCGGSSRMDKYNTAKNGSQDKLDSALWENDFLKEGRHIPENFKQADGKAKDLAAKMGYTGN
jgi:hypothetical protein